MRKRVFYLDFAGYGLQHVSRSLWGGGTTGGGTIKVATQSPLSGGQSAIGVDIKNGAELALEQLKEAAGRYGLQSRAGCLR